MTCNKCGKEIPEGAMCDCGTQPAKKKKSKLKILLLLSPLIAFLIIAILLSFGGNEGGEENGSSNSYVISAESGDGFGNVTFKLTFDEFINNYNACIDEDEENDTVAQMRYLKASDFEKTTTEIGVIEYSKNFGYYSGNKFNSLAKLFVYINPNTNTIQFVEYKWMREGYNTDDARVNYYFTLPASLFSMLDDSVSFPFDDDTSSYKETYDAIAENGIVVKGDSFYKYMSISESTHSIVFSAATTSSDYYKTNEAI